MRILALGFRGCSMDCRLWRFVARFLDVLVSERLVFRQLDGRVSRFTDAATAYCGLDGLDDQGPGPRGIRGNESYVTSSVVEDIARLEASQAIERTRDSKHAGGGMVFLLPRPRYEAGAINTSRLGVDAIATACRATGTDITGYHALRAFRFDRAY